MNSQRAPRCLLLPLCPRLSPSPVITETGGKEFNSQQSALSLLAEAGVHALSSWRCGDLGRLIPEDVLDIPAVSFMFKSEDAGAACAVQVNPSTSLRDGMVVRAQYVKGKQIKGGMCVALSPLRSNTSDAAGKLLQVKERFAPTCRWQFLVQPLASALGAFPGSKPSFVWTPCMKARECPQSARDVRNVFLQTLRFA